MKVSTRRLVAVVLLLAVGAGYWEFSTRDARLVERLVQARTLSATVQTLPSFQRYLEMNGLRISFCVGHAISTPLSEQTHQVWGRVYADIHTDPPASTDGTVPVGWFAADLFYRGTSSTPSSMSYTFSIDATTVERLVTGDSELVFLVKEAARLGTLRASIGSTRFFGRAGKDGALTITIEMVEPTPWMPHSEGYSLEYLASYEQEELPAILGFVRRELLRDKDTLLFRSLPGPTPPDGRSDSFYSTFYFDSSQGHPLRGTISAGSSNTLRIESAVQEPWLKEDANVTFADLGRDKNVHFALDEDHERSIRLVMIWPRGTDLRKVRMDYGASSKP